MMLIGCDFSSAPTARKPIVTALGRVEGKDVTLCGFEHFASLDAWSRWLDVPGEWVGAFDFPFGLPRELVTQLGWPLQWRALMDHYASLSRAEIRSTFAAFCAGRPTGRKFAHRATDGPAGSSPSMKWVNPPVAFMLHAGVPRLLAAGVGLPGLHMPDWRTTRIALEGYPGLLARRLIGRRSYKSDSRSAQTPERDAARVALLAALEDGSGPLELRLVPDEAARRLLMNDGNGDRIDAVLCLMQAAWSALRIDSAGPGYGLALAMDPLEGWIATI